MISDKLAGKLRIVIEDAGEGIWRFSDDPQDKRRTSEAPKHWI